jgi:UDP-galactopyranose mutase
VTSADYLVVGAGLTGAVIARTLKDAGLDVLVVERRSHLGGNVHDFVHDSGIRVHTYGPHYFRTNSSKVWEFVTRYSEFYRYEAVLASWVDGRYEHWPVNEEYIQRTTGADWKPMANGRPDNFEIASLAMMPEAVYRKFVKGYTEKQWGVPASSLSADLADRFDVRHGADFRLKPHRYQGIPDGGYAAFTSNILDGITVAQECDYLRQRERFDGRRAVIFTGPIDEFFGFDLGRLTYRGQLREHTYLRDTDLAQPFGQVNNPDPANGPHVRTLEWKHMLSPAERKTAVGTVLTTEVPYSPSEANDYEYPFPDAANKALYQRYRDRVRFTSGLVICGRLGEYRYYDMDQAIARAMLIAGRLLGT